MGTIFYLIAGLVSGVLGGMGMGGGTILIPVLTIFLGVEQHVAQATNLIAFLPTALLSLKLHQDKGLLESKGTLYIVIPAVIISVLTGFIAVLLPSEILQKLFGLFLTVLAFKGIFSLFFRHEK